MRKILQSIGLFLIAFIIAIPGVLADSISTSISGASEIEAGEEFTLTFKATSGTNIWGLTAKLNYDSSKLSIVSSSAGSGFNLTLGANIVIDATSGVNAPFIICTIKFKALTGFVANESTTVSLSNVQGSDGNVDINGSGSSKIIKVVPPKSSNNYLSGLAVDVGTIKFNKATNSYTIVVENAVTTANITATAEDATAKISGTGSKQLSVYTNTFSIVVTAENGTKRTYKIYIKRKDQDGNTAKISSDNFLKELTITGYNIDFNKATTEYSIEVENDVEVLEIIASANDSGATVNVIKPDALVTGENIITVEVTSKSGEKATYTIKVNKKEKQVDPEPIVDDKKEEEKENKDTSFSHTKCYIFIGVLGVLFVASFILNILFYKKIKNRGV